MKRAFLLFLTACIVAVCFTLLFTACTVDDKENICEHEYGTAVTSPTCTERGFTVYTCKKCNESYTADYVEALGHDCTDHAAQAPTCTEKGWEAYQTCSRCDYTTYKELNALGHDVERHAEKEPTCTKFGWEAYEACSRCDYTTYKKLEALTHDVHQYAAKEPTCTEIGWNAYEACSRGDYSTYQELPALTHDLTPHAAKEPTCTEFGWEAYETCSRCDYTTYNRLDALSHDLTAHAAKEATCTEIGWNAYEECSRGDYNTYSQIDPTYAHAYEEGCCKWCDEPYPTLDALDFQLKNNSYEVTVTDKTAVDVIIPSLYKGKFVTSVGAADVDEYTAFTSITIPSSITYIDSSAFANCPALTVYCQGDGTDLGDKWNTANCPVVWNYAANEVADDGCIYRIIDGVRYALKDGKATVVRQPSSLGGVVSVGQAVSYKGVTYAVETIDAEAFKSCTQITEISLPFVGGTADDSNKFGYVFNGNNGSVPASLKVVTITGGNFITAYAFMSCTNVTTVNLPDSITAIGSYAFSSCSSLLSMVIPEKVKDINVFTFSWCTSLKEVKLPSGLKKIWSQAFNNCNKLEKIVIPASVTAIESNAFPQCSSLNIYCEIAQSAKPSDWAGDWNSSRPVTWGYKET